MAISGKYKGAKFVAEPIKKVPTRTNKKPSTVDRPPNLNHFNPVDLVKDAKAGDIESAKVIALLIESVFKSIAKDSDLLSAIQLHTIIPNCEVLVQFINETLESESKRTELIKIFLPKKTKSVPLSVRRWMAAVVYEFKDEPKPIERALAEIERRQEMKRKHLGDLSSLPYKDALKIYQAPNGRVTKDQVSEAWRLHKNEIGR